jgi:hypothetical protein
MAWGLGGLNCLGELDGDAQLFWRGLGKSASVRGVVCWFVG